MKKLILAVSILCFAAAVLILILMPKPEKTLPLLPDASFNADVRSVETNKDGLIKLIKFPVISPLPENETDFTAINDYLRSNEESMFENADLPFQEGDTASYILNSCDLTLKAGDFISFKTEGFFSNVTENYHDIIKRSSNVNVVTGEVIGFEDVISDLHRFEKAVSSGRFVLMSSDNSLDNLSSTEVLTNYSPENNIYPDYYIDGEYFVVIFRAPSSMGGLTQYGIPLLEAEKFLNKNNEYISMIYEGK